MTLAQNWLKTALSSSTLSLQGLLVSTIAESLSYVLCFDFFMQTLWDRTHWKALLGWLFRSCRQPSIPWDICVASSACVSCYTRSRWAQRKPRWWSKNTVVCIGYWINLFIFDVWVGFLSHLIAIFRLRYMLKTSHEYVFRISKPVVVTLAWVSGVLWGKGKKRSENGRQGRERNLPLFLSPPPFPPPPLKSTFSQHPRKTWCSRYCHFIFRSRLVWRMFTVYLC